MVDFYVIACIVAKSHLRCVAINQNCWLKMAFFSFFFCCSVFFFFFFFNQQLVAICIVIATTLILAFNIVIVIVDVQSAGSTQSVYIRQNFYNLNLFQQIMLIKKQINNNDMNLELYLLY